MNVEPVVAGRSLFKGPPRTRPVSLPPANFGEAPWSSVENTRAEARADLVPLAEAARRYMEIMSPMAAVPRPEQLAAVERELAGRLPLFQLPDGAMATTRAALDSYIALKRA